MGGGSRLVCWYNSFISVETPAGHSNKLRISKTAGNCLLLSIVFIISAGGGVGGLTDPITHLKMERGKKGKKRGERETL